MISEAGGESANIFEINALIDALINALINSFMCVANKLRFDWLRLLPDQLSIMQTVGFAVRNKWNKSSILFYIA